MRVVRRVAVVFAAIVLVLAALAATAYLFGGMWTRTPKMKDAYDELVTDGSRPEVDGPTVIPLPGCVCHSDDPTLQAEHSVRRIRECAECH
jgi:hypothetical protein